jgi:hypothetical protein
MSRLRSRVDRLVRHYASRQQGARCSLCRPWPNARILEVDVNGTETWADPSIPERCPTCGWCPIVVQVIEVMDWRSVGKHGIH